MPRFVTGIGWLPGCRDAARSWLVLDDASGAPTSGGGRVAAGLLAFGLLAFAGPLAGDVVVRVTPRQHDTPCR